MTQSVRSFREPLPLSRRANPLILYRLCPLRLAALHIQSLNNPQQFPYETHNSL